MKEPRAATAFRIGVIVGLQGLRARPLRTTLAGLSLLLGVLAVMCVQASSQVAAHAVIAHAELTEGRAPTWGMDLAPNTRTLEAAQTVRESVSTYAGRTSVAIVVRSEGALGAGDAVLPLRIVAMVGDLREIRPFPLRAGEWLKGESVGLAPHLVINIPAADRLDTGQTMSTLRIGATTERPRATIVGIVDDGEIEPTAYVSLAEAHRWSPGIAETAQTTVLVHEFESDPPVRAAIKAGLTAQQVVTQPFRRIDQSSSLRSSVAAVQRIFVVIAGIALVVGVISILNIGLATIGERVDELALRRAVGTTRSQLAGVVLVEALLVGAFAATCALCLGVVLLRPVTRSLFPDLPIDTVAFPISAAILGISVSCTAAMMGGLVPAFRAARIPIASAMRA